MHQTKAVGCLILFLLAGGVGGCTFTQVQSDGAAAPAYMYGAITVGDITAAEHLWDRLVPHFRQGLLQEMRKRHAFPIVLDATTGALVDTSIVLSGRITEVDKGSEALRWLVGFGAGRARVQGRFLLRTAGGETVATFEARESYAGGFGLGGKGFLDMEDLMRRLGETVAKQTVQWARGSPRQEQEARERE